MPRRKRDYSMSNAEILRIISVATMVGLTRMILQCPEIYITHTGGSHYPVEWKEFIGYGPPPAIAVIDGFKQGIAEYVKGVRGIKELTS